MTSYASSMNIQCVQVLPRGRLALAEVSGFVVHILPPPDRRCLGGIHVEVVTDHAWVNVGGLSAWVRLCCLLLIEGQQLLFLLSTEKLFNTAKRTRTCRSTGDTSNMHLCGQKTPKVPCLSQWFCLFTASIADMLGLLLIVLLRSLAAINLHLSSFPLGDWRTAAQQQRSWQFSLVTGRSKEESEDKPSKNNTKVDK